jgi:hypothetical protein
LLIKHLVIKNEKIFALQIYFSFILIC